jgi:Zn ribbon nucleic-acid-binding protein
VTKEWPMPSNVLHASPYCGRHVALLTRHCKEKVIRPVLEPAIGCRIELVEGFDTDQLGSFTGDIPRAGTQLEAARRKARIGMMLSGLPHGLASEGSFGPDPMMGMTPWNVEYLIWIDDMLALEVVGRAQGKAYFAHALTSDWAHAERFARQSGFPEHHLVIRPDTQDDPRIRKGISGWSELEAVFQAAQHESLSGSVFLQTDVRAHANPTRQNIIRYAAEDLLAKLKSSCPACDAPGFWIVDRITGLPCANCGVPTQETRAEVLGCVKCQHRLTRFRTDLNAADPSRCSYCNP